MVPSLAAQVAGEIGRRIVIGDYKEGDLIEDEGALAERYGVSRTAVRDAVKILSGKGLLRARRGIGTLVKPRSAWGLLDSDVLAWHQSAPPSADFLGQLLEVRQTVEPTAAFLAAQRANTEDVASIMAAYRCMEEEERSVERFVHADAMFHRAILNSTNNIFLSVFEGVVFSALLASINLTNRDPRNNKESILLHRNVAHAIKSRQSAEAERCMKILLADTRRRLDEFGTPLESNHTGMNG